MLCSHGGQAMPTVPSPRGAGVRHAGRHHRRAVRGRRMRLRAAGRQRALRHRAVDRRARCRSLSQGQPVAIMTGISICVPTGTPLLPVSAQTRVIAT